MWGRREVLVCTVYPRCWNYSSSGQKLHGVEVTSIVGVIAVAELYEILLNPMNSYNIPLNPTEFFR